MGTATFSDVCLRVIEHLPIKIVMVVTKPDKLGNRHQLAVPDVKKTCLEKNIPFIQPDKLAECRDLLASLQPDFLVTCSFGKIVPNSILKIFKKCINVHASLLPAYRGASPIQMAIKNMDHETGISLMEMISELDAGKVYWQKHVDIADNETYSSLLQKFYDSLNEEFLSALQNIFDGKLEGTEQDKLIASGHKLSFAPIITKEMCFINWNDSATKINAYVRSLFSKPLARTKYEEIVVKILSCKVVKDSEVQFDQQGLSAGAIVNIDKKGILVKTIDPNEYLLIEQLQLPDKNPVHVFQLINGKHPFKKNAKFF